MALLKLADFNVYRFSLPFVQPMKVGNTLLHQREGYLLELTDIEGNKAFGEIAPLTGLDPTSLHSCRQNLSALRNILVNTTLNTDHFDLTSPALGMMPLPVALTTHTLFGLEGALLGLYLQCHPLGRISVPVNGLFLPDPDDHQAASRIEALRQTGTNTIKVKVGRLPADQEIRQILRLADAIGKDLRLRLDGNQALSQEAYTRYFKALSHLNVEYAEEPLRDKDTWSSPEVPWPVAMDESLPRYLNASHPDPASLPPLIRTVILKPGLLPGLSGMAAFLASARKHNLQTVLSSSFNTGVGLTTLCLLSGLAGIAYHTACGLDTLRYLQADILQHFPPIANGALSISENWLKEMQLNHGVLNKEEP